MKSFIVYRVRIVVCAFLLAGNCVRMENLLPPKGIDVHACMSPIPSRGMTYPQGATDAGSSNDERPGMSVSFSYDYWLDSTEVTQAAVVFHEEFPG
jgi:hypothetical protein